MNGRRRTPSDPNTYLIDEVEVSMTIIDDKLTAESTSGSTGGKLKVADRETDVSFVLEGTGSDEAVVSLSGPQLDRLQTILTEISDQGEGRRGDSPPHPP